MSTTLAVSLESLNEQGRGVRVEFQKHCDRFGHTIFSIQGKDAQPLLHSIEGTAEETAPPSPPFAELHQQERTLFLTGATTLGHWSMSVQAIDGCVFFDVACRAKAEASNLGSTYHVLTLNHDVQPGNETLLEPLRDRLLIVPSLQAASAPTTIQWRYAVASKFQ